MSNIKKLKLVTKSFVNTAGGFERARTYAEDNDLVLRTTWKEFCDNNIRYKNERGCYPTDYMFVFEMWKDFDLSQIVIDNDIYYS